MHPNFGTDINSFVRIKPYATTTTKSGLISVSASVSLIVIFSGCLILILFFSAVFLTGLCVNFNPLPDLLLGCVNTLTISCLDLIKADK